MKILHTQSCYSCKHIFLLNIIWPACIISRIYVKYAFCRWKEPTERNLSSEARSSRTIVNLVVHLIQSHYKILLCTALINFCRRRFTLLSAYKSSTAVDWQLDWLFLKSCPKLRGLRVIASSNTLQRRGCITTIRENSRMGGRFAAKEAALPHSQSCFSRRSPLI